MQYFVYVLVLRGGYKEGSRGCDASKPVFFSKVIHFVNRKKTKKTKCIHKYGQ